MQPPLDESWAEPCVCVCVHLLSLLSVLSVLYCDVILLHDHTLLMTAASECITHCSGTCSLQFHIQHSSMVVLRLCSHLVYAGGMPV